MRGSRKPLRWVGVAAILLVATWLSGAQAQYLSYQLDDADGERLFRNPSPRLGAMGLLGIAVEDENNEITLFDYIGSPAGLLADRDSTSIDFQFDFASSKSKWTGVDPWAYSPAGPHWPNFIDFGKADLETRFGFQRYNALAAYRHPNDFSIAARVDYVRSNQAQDVTKFDVSYITAVGEEDDAVPETLFVGEMSRDSVSSIQSWVFDVMADKEVSPGFHVAGHAVFSLEDLTPNVFHSPDSLTIQATRPVVVDPSTDPAAAFRLREISNPSGNAKGVGGGAAFSYELGKYVTLGASGDVLATDEEAAMKGPFFRQELTRDTFLKTGKVHGLCRLGRILEGAVKHQSKNMDGDGRYFWSFGCPLQGGGFDYVTVEGLTADRESWEERTGTRWLIRVPETSIKLAVEYESARGGLTIKPDSAYGSHVFVVPFACSEGENAAFFPRYALIIDDQPMAVDIDESDFAAGASVTLWFGRRPVTLATEYQNWSRDVSEVSGWREDREISSIKLGSEISASRRITVRAGGVWGRETIGPSGGAWDERTLTLGGSYVLVPGMRQVEVAYMYRSREPDFEDLYKRDTTDHRLTAYTRIFF